MGHILTRMGRVISIAALVFALCAAPATGSPSARVVGIDDVAGLGRYLTGRFGPGWMDRKDIFLVRLIDLDEEPDGIDEILLSVDAFDPAWCSNAGCDYEVLVRQPDGELKAVTSYKGFGLKVADTTTNGVRDLISETLRGNRRFNLAGETSGTRHARKPGRAKDV